MWKTQMYRLRKPYKHVPSGGLLPAGSRPARALERNGQQVVLHKDILIESKLY